MNLALLSTAASLGIIHTAIGVDHYIPFVAMSKSNQWSYPKTMLIVFICGVGHIMGSVILGLVGIWFGSQVTILANIEDKRGDIATWLLISFGAIYMLWGIRKAIQNKPHRHITDSGEEVWHSHHAKNHDMEAAENHAEQSGVARSFWPLFILLVLGPCEPLIPLLIYPAAETGMMAVAATAIVFAICTIATMLLCTTIVLKGISMISIKNLERYAHSLAGFAVLVCGLAIRFLGI
ncbi:MAG: sulfite exporter TauE/SafE family protein [Oscillospiraceae bacterium]|nr:sulfite exporter TauE/SafE family protein [Oscillospiraceae bacterium]